MFFFDPYSSFFVSSSSEKGCLEPIKISSTTAVYYMRLIQYCGYLVVHNLEKSVGLVRNCRNNWATDGTEFTSVMYLWLIHTGSNTVRFGIARHYT